MVKAELVLLNGTKVVVEGLPDDVAGVIAKFSSRSGVTQPALKEKGRPAITTVGATRGGGPLSLIRDLADEDYFEVRRSIGDIQTRLEERGHIYPVTSLSPALLRLTKNRTIRRLKEGKAWVYVK
jgi:hypothetical protein